MSWIDRIFSKNTSSSSRKANVPEGVWTKCTACEQVLYREELKRHLEVCPKCGHHMRIDARERLLGLLDQDSVQELAAECPFVCFSASGGARMQEALFSLMQMAKTSAVLAKMREKGVPFISVLTDPTLGGVSASFAMLGDINIAEPKALIGFAGPRVIEQTVREKLPEGFQRSEFLLEKGAIDMIVKRADMRNTLASLVSKLMNKPSPFVESELITEE